MGSRLLIKLLIKVYAEIMTKSRKANIILEQHDKDDEDDQWTTACLSEELFQRLASIKTVTQKDGRDFTISPYRQQAKELMYRIPIYKPNPPFIVKWRDLGSKIQGQILELRSHCKQEIFEEIIVDTIGRLFEITNPRYYHGSVRKYLKVKFVS